MTGPISACTAYTRYVLDIGQSEDWLALQVALAPCLLGYGAVAQMLARHPATVRERERNTYWPWIENYGAADYVEAVRLGSGACLFLSFLLCVFPQAPIVASGVLLFRKVWIRRERDFQMLWLVVLCSHYCYHLLYYVVV